MACAGIHFSGFEQPEAHISIPHKPRHAAIVVNVSEWVVLYLPNGAEGPKVARALAAVLLKAASEQDALLASDTPDPFLANTEVRKMGDRKQPRPVPTDQVRPDPPPAPPRKRADWEPAAPQTDLAALAAKILSTSTLGKVALASVLIQTGKVDIAESVLEAALDDLRATRLLGIVRAPLMKGKDGE